MDTSERLLALLEVLGGPSSELPAVFPMHLRTRLCLMGMGDWDGAPRPGLRVTEPLGYLDFIGLTTAAAAVLIDSGGVKEETSCPGVPCGTVRTTTERPATIELGPNRLVDPGDMGGVLAAATSAVQAGPVVPSPCIPLRDRHAGERVVEALAGWAAERMAQ